MTGRASESAATFNTYSATNVWNVAGDQNISGGQHLHQESHPGALADAVRVLAGHISDLPLSDGARNQARRAIADAEAGVARDEPDHRRVAGGLHRFVEILEDFGGIAAAGPIVFDALRAAASALGPVGATLLRLLSL